MITSRAGIGSKNGSGGRFTVAPILLIGEVAGAISRRTATPADGRAAAASLLQSPSLQLVLLDEDLGRSTATVAADLGLRGADATYVAVAQRYNLPLLTWDREQANRARTIITVQTPEELSSA